MQLEPAKSIAAGPEVPVLSPGIDETEIARRAYQLWEQRGCPTGSSESDWYQAEAELRANPGNLPD
jgi:hypothetical protein